MEASTTHTFLIPPLRTTIFPKKFYRNNVQKKTGTHKDSGFFRYGNLVQLSLNLELESQFDHIVSHAWLARAIVESFA